MKTFAVGILLVALTGCSGSREFIVPINKSVFRWFGKTYFSDVMIVNTKELHLDTNQFVGKDVIIQGKIISIGEHYTHLVLMDDKGRMLVALTKLPEIRKMLKNGSVKNVRIFGTTERGKKGTAFIMAKSVYADKNADRSN